MEFVQGKASFNEMATGILVKLFADYPSHSEFDYSDWGWNDERSELLRNTLLALKDMGYIDIISSTDMDYAAKLTPLGVSVLTQKAPTSGDTFINVLKSAAGESRTAVIGAIIGWIFGGK
ncbi:Uncharacterised protein [Klebsiella quasivariicola]|uniref:hypothetical protein n=1 Tax=Klebsiella TaxID=570 RepID=UPI0004E46ECF|nr:MULTISPECIES: hypothetical protein [Klebsiella]KFC41628.1 hypothetical protein FF19_07675 [Klebsiella michiganensis]MCU6318869.1 hypothetical protein [Klebsiella aerogenes]SXD43991.1 Uncharacterised protein [Klebsiella quasivariicola]HDZ2603036.1 hypothetical protein [Klebsiella pneumoniae]